MKKELFENLIKLRKLGYEMGLPIKQIAIMDFYAENILEQFPRKILGIKVENGRTNKIIIGGKQLFPVPKTLTKKRINN